MKILHLVDSLEPGGMENGVVNLIRGLRPEFEGHVACLTRRGAFAERVPEPQRVFALGKKGGFSPLVVWRLLRSLVRLRPAVLHTHNLGPLIYAGLATAGGRLCPILHGEHAMFTEDEKSARRLKQRRSLYKTCRAVHVVAPAIREELLAFACPHSSLHVIPNGVDMERFSPGERAAARSRFGLPAEGTVLGIVGRFGPHKGHLALIEAFATLPASCHLLIVGGGGPKEQEVHKAAAASLVAARIHFTGFLAEPADAYRALDLLTIPSTNEGMANAALEAMACAVPMLGNTGCGHEALIENGREGIIADLRSPTALAREIARLIAQPALLCEMGARARARVCDAFSIRTMLDAYARLYRDVSRPS